MSVYVDGARGKFRGMIMCHMIADTLSELHAMAESIGIRREWFQDSPPASSPHYDVSLSKRQMAIANWAVPVDNRTMAEILGRLRKDRLLKRAGLSNQRIEGT